MPSYLYIVSASTRFRDTLAGRKEEVWLTPMISCDREDFPPTDLPHRLQRGGLPPFFLAGELPEKDYQEWMDAFWAKDVLELFRLERRHSFLKFVELMMIHSGGIFEATRYARPCEVSRTTIANYLAVLEATFVTHAIRPFARRRAAEIVAAPKVYAFDTGFLCYYRGWNDLRPEDLGLLWEHYVLNELQARAPTGARIHYWRTKHGNEIDFVVIRRGRDPVAIECKWTVSDFQGDNLKVFRRHYPEGRNFVVASDVERSFTRTLAGGRVSFVSLESLISALNR